MHIRQKTNDKRKTNAAPRQKLRLAVLFSALFLALALTGCARGGGEEDYGGVVFFPASLGAAGQCQGQE